MVAWRWPTPRVHNSSLSCQIKQCRTFCKWVEDHIHTYPFFFLNLDSFICPFNNCSVFCLCLPLVICPACLSLVLCCELCPPSHLICDWYFFTIPEFRPTFSYLAHQQFPASSICLQVFIPVPFLLLECVSNLTHLCLSLSTLLSLNGSLSFSIWVLHQSAVTIIA